MGAIDIPFFTSFGHFQIFLENTYILHRDARIKNRWWGDYEFRSVWDKYSRHTEEMRRLICSSQETFEAFLAGALPADSASGSIEDDILNSS